MPTIADSSRESKGSLFQLDGGSEEGYTIVQNAFIRRFMPSAPGDMVKVYLAGLMRCYGRCGEQFASNETIAREQGVHPRYVAKAWAYWEGLGLIRRLPRFLKAPNDYTDYSTVRNDTYRYQTSNLILFTSDLAALPVDNPVDKGGVSVQASGGMSVGASRRNKPPLATTKNKPTRPNNGQVGSGLSEGRREAPYEEVEALVRILMDITGKETPADVGNLDRNTISRLILTYGLVDTRAALWDAADAVFAGKANMQRVLGYTEGILRNRSRRAT